MVATLVKVPDRDKSICPESVDIALNVRFIFDTSDETLKLYNEIKSLGLNFSMEEANGFEKHPVPALHDEPFWHFGRDKIRAILPLYSYLVSSGRMGN